MRGEFTLLDWLVLGSGFVGITVFRAVDRPPGEVQRRLFPRRRPAAAWWVMTGQAFGTGTHAERSGGAGGATYQLGFATIWYQWKNMLITPFYWLMAPWYRRCERTDPAKMMDDRYGRGMAMVYTLFAMSYFVFNQGTMMKGAGKVVSVATGGEIISANQEVVLVMVGAFLLYSFFGGLLASAYTDFVQGFSDHPRMSFLLIPAGLMAVGSFSGMHAQPANFFELYNESSGVDAFTIIMLSLNGLIGITAQPHILTMNATGRTEPRRPRRPDVRVDAQAVLHHRLGIYRVDRRRDGGRARRRAGRQEEGLRLRVPAPAGTGAGGTDGGLRAGGQHVDLLEFHGQHRRVFTRNLYQPYWRPQASDRGDAAGGAIRG